jgi:predicted ABC-type ATPase
MIARIREHRDRRESFAFETTLATRSFVPFLAEARAVGYLVHIVFIALRDPALALTRVQERVERGGHDVPQDVIRRRFRRGLANLTDLYLPICDTWVIYDNSGSRPAGVAFGDSHSGTRVVDPQVWHALFERHE